MSEARRQRLYFHLQVAASRIRAHADRVCIDEAGISTAQAAALAVIHDNAGISQRLLARTLRQAEPSVTSMVARLLDAALIERRVDPDDRRVRFLATTAAGEAALRAAEGAFAAVNERIDAALDPEEVAAVADALRRIVADDRT